MLSHVNKERAFIAPGLGQLKNFDCNEYRSLPRIGINLRESDIRKMMSAYNHAVDSIAMDAIQPTITTPSVGTPVQFLQNWLPGFVFIITAARKIDDIIGIMITGSWEDEQIVQGVLERTGAGQPYGDYTNVPLSSWNVNFNFRTVVRFEEGMKVGVLESARAARMLVDDAGMKREAAALNLEINRNLVGFFGFNNGANNTYGFLNDPGLSAFVVVANGASGSPQWFTKTFLEIVADIRTAIVQLRTQSQDTIDPEKIDLTMVVATNAVDQLSTPSDFGISVRDWMKQAYPRIRVVSAPQLNNAGPGNSGVFYLQADQIDDMSTDGGRVWIQPVPTKLQTLGVQQLAKAYEEDYSNATAGAMCKRPYAVTRFYGIS